MIGFYGFSGSGKTTLIESLIGDLAARGLNLAVIKQSDKRIRLDTPGKDTYRFQDAGAAVVALASQSETDVIVNAPLGLNQIVKMIHSTGAIDLVIVESASDPEIPKIRVGGIDERANTIWTYDGDYEMLLDMIIHL